MDLTKWWWKFVNGYFGEMSYTDLLVNMATLKRIQLDGWVVESMR